MELIQRKQGRKKKGISKKQDHPSWRDKSYCATAMLPSGLRNNPSTHSPPALPPPSWSPAILCGILAFKAHFKPCLHLASPTPFTNLLQPPLGKALAFALTLHQCGLGHVRFVLSRLKEGSMPAGTNYMNVLSTLPCTQQALCMGVELN